MVSGCGLLWWRRPGGSHWSLTDCCCVAGNVFVVQWDRVRLKKRETEGHFTFQAALHRNGTIVFGYIDVSLSFSSSLDPSSSSVVVGHEETLISCSSGPGAGGPDQLHGAPGQGGTL